MPFTLALKAARLWWHVTIDLLDLARRAYDRWIDDLVDLFWAGMSLYAITEEEFLLAVETMASHWTAEESAAA